jgi:GntR family transcriptional regulator / MocR family aminotransferase
LKPKNEYRSRQPRMSSVSSLVGSLGAPTKTNTKTYLHRQLFERLRQAIVSGQIQSGARLPSTRILAAELNLSRNTTVTAYALLDADGLIETRIGGGTMVKALSERRLQTEHRSSGRQSASALVSGNTPPSDRARDVFKVGVPAYEHFPMRTWNATIHRCAVAQTAAALTYQDAAGHIGLRRLLAGYLLTRRGLRCDADRIIVVAGYQAGLNLTLQALLEAKDEVWVEDPGHIPTRAAICRAGMAVRPVPVDAEGIQVLTGIHRWPNAKLAVVTPAHQFPLGMSLSQERRRQLISWARSSKRWIVEDDYDTEFHFVGNPPDSLAGTADEEPVVYIGTFSKVLYPSLRIGYVVVPPALVDRFAALRRMLDGHQPHFMQDVVHRFIEEGHFDRHLGKMRALYRRRQIDLMTAITDVSKGRLRPIETAGGTHLTALFDENVDDIALTELAKRAGIEMAPLASYRIHPGAPGLVLGFSNCSEFALRAAMGRLSAILASVTHPVRVANRRPNDLSS